MAAATETDELRYWLANEDWYTSQYTRRWLDKTPPEQAANVLAHIAEGADAEPRAGWGAVVTAMANSGFFPSDAIAGGKPQARKAGTRAALLLAEKGDPRCVAPLLRVYGQGKYAEQVRSALTGFLAGVPDPAAVRPCVPALRALAEQVWQYGGTARDLAPADAALLVAVLRCLNPAADPADAALARSFVPAQPARQPNRARVAAQAAAV
jgi:hypothetical protein